MSGHLRITVRVAGDDTGRWADGLGGVATVERVTAGTALLSLASRVDAQAVLDRPGPRGRSSSSGSSEGGCRGVPRRDERLHAACSGRRTR